MLFCRKNCKKYAGFTLMELVMAIVVAAIIAIPLSVTIASYVKGAFASQNTAMAVALARYDIERVNKMPYASMVSASFSNYLGYSYDVRRTVSYIQGNGTSAESLKKIVVDVRRSGNPTVLASFTTYFAKILFMAYNQSKLDCVRGFTLIETIMVIAIVVVLALSGGWLMMHFVRDSVFLSNQLNMDMLAADALNGMIEGDSQAKGLRLSRRITAIADTQVTFVNQDGQTIRFRLDTATGQLYRAVNGGAEVVIPSYLKAGIKILGKNGKLFLFYNRNEVLTVVPAQVRWISLTLIAQSGTGLFTDWEGSAERASAVAVARFQ